MSSYSLCPAFISIVLSNFNVNKTSTTNEITSQFCCAIFEKNCMSLHSVNGDNGTCG